MKGILIGGLLPALLYSFSATLQKASTRAGIGMALLMVFVSAGVFIASCAMYFVMPDSTVNIRSALYAMALGVCWCLGTGAVGLALVRYNVPLSKLVPLYNMNTLITVIFGLIVFMEWKQVDKIQLIAGAILVVVGGIMVAKA